jgi:hypothetical protein
MSSLPLTVLGTSGSSSTPAWRRFVTSIDRVSKSRRVSMETTSYLYQGFVTCKYLCTTLCWGSGFPRTVVSAKCSPDTN